MSEEWIFYPCQMREQRASIFYDHGIRETIDQFASPQLLKVGITLKQPRTDGLSSNEEYQGLCALEDELQAVVQEHGSLYVGRVTVGGHRYLHIFTSDSENYWASKLQAVGQHHGYELNLNLKPDPNRSGYWQDLFPSDDDWQVILDLRVLESVEKNGDDGSASRQIDHWTYFPTLDAANQFSTWAQNQKYSSVITNATEDRKYCVRFAHEGTLRLPDITSHSIALRRKASELGGNYDGWETPICKSSPK